MATSNLTQAQQRVLDKLVRDYDEATTMDFETWAWKSAWCGGGRSYRSYDELVEWLGRLAMRLRLKDIDGYVQEDLSRMRESYESFRAGILRTRTSSHTLRAMERKGYIEIIHDTANESYNLDTVRLLHV